jgi:hypothetical protein
MPREREDRLVFGRPLPEFQGVELRRIADEPDPARIEVVDLLADIRRFSRIACFIGSRRKISM